MTDDAGVGEPANHPEQNLDLGVGEDGRRLVEDQHVGVAGQRLGDGHLLLLGDGQRPRPARSRSAAGRPSSARSSTTFAFCAAQSIRPPLRISRPMKMFSDDGELGEQLRLLVDGRDAEAPCASVVEGIETGRPSKVIVPGVGGIRAGQDLDHRGLAGAVLADQGVHPAGSNGHVAVRMARTAPKRLAMPVICRRGDRRPGWPTARGLSTDGHGPPDRRCSCGQRAPDSEGTAAAARPGAPGYRSEVVVVDVVLGDGQRRAEQQHLVSSVVADADMSGADVVAWAGTACSAANCCTRPRGQAAQVLQSHRIDADDEPLSRYGFIDAGSPCPTVKTFPILSGVLHGLRHTRAPTTSTRRRSPSGRGGRSSGPWPSASPSA